MIKRGLFWSGLLLAIAVAASFYASRTVPPDTLVPAHFNLRGEADRYAPFGVLVWVVPAVIAGLNVALAALPLLDPRKDNLRRSAGLYLTGWIGGTFIATAAHLAVMYAAVTGDAPEVRFIFAAAGLVVAVIGNFLAKSRSNWFAGVRTPWTLSSEHAWVIANRIAGWGFVLTGLATVAASLLSSTPETALVLTAGVLASALVAVVASYFAWRADPDRTV